MKLFKKIFHIHKWKRIEGTTHLYNAGISKIALYECLICGKKRWIDIFKVKEVQDETN